ncbi:MAG: endonuclease/exonuclease/phosphatase family protein, partial [Psychrobacter celer]
MGVNEYIRHYKNNREYMNNKADNHQFYIATANLLNFANPNRIYYDNAPAYNDTEYNHKLRGISELLAKAHADIIAVQEVWDSAALVALAAS